MNKLTGHSYTTEFYAGINILDVKLYSTYKGVHSILLSDQNRLQTRLCSMIPLRKKSYVCPAVYTCVEWQYRRDLWNFHFFSLYFSVLLGFILKQ